MNENRANQASNRILLMFLAVFCLLTGCFSSLAPYKVTFGNGRIEYFNLNYKPKANANYIIYQDDTIFNVSGIKKL